MGVSSLDSINYWIQWDNVTTDGKYSLSSKTLANVTLSLSASAANPGPRDTVIYTITYNNTGDGIAANVLISAPVPALTTYAAGSIKVNGTPKPDLSAGITVGSVINLNLGTLLGVPITPGLNGSIEYKVVIN